MALDVHILSTFWNTCRDGQGNPLSSMTAYKKESELESEQTDERVMLSDREDDATNDVRVVIFDKA